MTDPHARLGLVAMLALGAGVLSALALPLAEASGQVPAIRSSTLGDPASPAHSRPDSQEHHRPSSPSHPNPPPFRSWVHLPILHYVGDDHACATWIEVQAAGSSPIKVALWTWGEPGFCPPQMAGPMIVECSGLIKPGATWVIGPDMVPTGARGGVLFKLSTRRLSDDGLDAVFGFDCTYADFVCDLLHYSAYEDATAYGRFREAYQGGGSFEGMPMDLAAGLAEGGLLAVEVVRECPADTPSGGRVASRYTGIAGHQLGAVDPMSAWWHGDSEHLRYPVPLVRVEDPGYATHIYAQNGGVDCASVELWLRPEDTASPARLCEVAELAPAETAYLDPGDCVGGHRRGSGWIRADQPMAVVVDVETQRSLMTYEGRIDELSVVFDPTIYPLFPEPTVEPCREAPVEPGSHALFGPLVYSGHGGWDTEIHLQNLNSSVAARAKVTMSEFDGSVAAALVDWVPPNGGRSLSLAAVHDLPSGWVGNVTVESQPWRTVDGSGPAASSLAGVAALSLGQDDDASGLQQAIAYNLLPEHSVFDWPDGASCGGLESGVGLVAIPSLVRESGGAGAASEIAIANVVPVRGFTSVALHIYDQNGFVHGACEKLNDRQTAYIDLVEWGFLGPGFRGSAIVSAWFWEHDLFAEDGRFVRNMVGLGALSVARAQMTVSDGEPAVRSTGSPGVPLSQWAIKDSEGRLRLAPEGLDVWCPGLPISCP